MKTSCRIKSLIKEHKLTKEQLNNPDTLPMSFKLDLVEDLIKHVHESGVEYPTYGNVNFKSAVIKLIALYEETQAPVHNSYFEFLKYSLKLATRIIKAYNKGATA